MIDFATQSKGRLGDGVWFSSLLLSALQSRFTGGVAVQTHGGEAVVFFRDGQPVNAAGAGFKDHHLGSLLVDRSLCRPEQLESALAEQENSNGARPLLGAILVRDGLDPAEIKRVIQAQTRERLADLMQLADGDWVSAAGENPRVREVGVPLDGWATLFELLQTRASSEELTHQTDALLGSSVRLRAGHAPDRAWTPAEQKLLNYLKKPRKPDQLERAMDRRQRTMVRGFLRALVLMERIETLPSTKAIPIPRTLGHTGTIAIPQPGSSSDVPVEDSNGVNPHHREVVRPPRRTTPHPLLAEIKAAHAAMEGKNHFELLGVPEDVETADLRKRFAELAKKFHPDAWPAEIEANAEVAQLGRDTWAKLNDAYNILNDEDKRQDYVGMLQDERIKGDYRKLEMIRDAELKYKMAVVHVRKREYGRARDLLRVAVENDPSCGLYLAELAYTDFSDPSQDNKAILGRVTEQLMEALGKDENEPRIHLFLGYVLKAQDRLRDAHYHFKKVSRLSPNNSEAATQLRYLKRRIDEDEKKSSGGLLGLFKKAKS